MVHIFNFNKYKKVYFTNVLVLKNISREKRKISRIRQLIIMSLRILAIAALVLVFANPYIPNKDAASTNSNLVNIYVDNSMSMTSKYGSYTLLDDAKNRAGKIVNYYGNKVLYRIITNNSPVNPPLLTGSDAMTAINNITNSLRTKNFSSVANIFNNKSGNLVNTEAINYVISDLQKNNIDTSLIPPVKDRTFVIPLTNNLNENLNLADVYFDAPVNISTNLQTLGIEVSNESPNDYEKVPVNLKIDDKIMASASIDIPSRQHTTFQMSYADKSMGLRQGMAEIDDKTMEFDNTFYFTYKIRPNIKILDINEAAPNKYISALFNNDSMFLFQVMNDKSINYDNIKNYDLIIVDNLKNLSSGLADELSKLLKTGKSVLLLPPYTLDLQSYNTFFSSIGTGALTDMIENKDENVDISLEASFFDDIFSDKPDLKRENVDLPKIHAYHPFEMRGNTISLLKLTDGRANIITQSVVEQGNMFIINTILDNEYSTLQVNAFFVPILYKMAFSGLKTNTYNFSTSDDIIPITAEANSENIKLVYDVDSTFTNYSIVEFNGGKFVQFTKQSDIPAGNYKVVADTNVVDGFSVNNDRTESSFGYYAGEDVEKYIDTHSQFEKVSVLNSTDTNFEDILRASVTNKELWKVFLIISIIAIVAEMTLLRLWSKKI